MTDLEKVFGHAYIQRCSGNIETCPNEECCICSIRDCPSDEPLHYHHDGCPACWPGE